jgi:Fur family transcriptional regulator, ferric uptake regulator
MLRSVFSAKTLRADAGRTSTKCSLCIIPGSATIFLLGTYCHRLHSIATENRGLPVEEPAATAFAPTLNRPLKVIEVAGMRTSHGIDHASHSRVNAPELTTVYRKLELLIAEGAVQVITLITECPRYEMAESAHHHHFQCNSCRRVYDVPGCLGDLRRLAARGFTVEHHDVTLYGRCRDCARRELR